MPELPEVEAFRALATSTLAGKRIVEVDVAKDARVFEGAAPERIRAALLDRTVLEVGRWGKHLWWRLDHGPHPRFHFGMTGGLVSRAFEPMRLESGTLWDGATWPPARSRLTVRTADGHELAFVTTRRFSRMILDGDPRATLRRLGLGADPLHTLPDAGDLARALASRRGSIKGCLLDQRVLAGLGNWVVDEVLCEARISPRRPARSLEDAEVAALHISIGRVLRTAVEVEAHAPSFPADWLFHIRWSNPVPTTRDGEAVEVARVAGRRTLFIPARQR